MTVQNVVFRSLLYKINNYFTANLLSFASIGVLFFLWGSIQGNIKLPCVCPLCALNLVGVRLNGLVYKLSENIEAFPSLFPSLNCDASVLF